MFLSYSQITDYNYLGHEAKPPKFQVNDRVRLNDELKRIFPNTYRYDLEYIVMDVTKCADTEGHTNTVMCNELPDFVGRLHDSWLDLVTCGHKCTCDFHSVVMITGCKCGGK